MALAFSLKSFERFELSPLRSEAVFLIMFERPDRRWCALIDNMQPLIDDSTPLINNSELVVKNPYSRQLEIC